MDDPLGISSTKEAQSSLTSGIEKKNWFINNEMAIDKKSWQNHDREGKH